MRSLRKGGVGEKGCVEEIKKNPKNCTIGPGGKGNLPTSYKEKLLQNVKSVFTED